MKEKIKRTKVVKTRMSEEELEYFNRKFELSGLKSKSEFMRMLFLRDLS